MRRATRVRFFDHAFMPPCSRQRGSVSPFHAKGRLSDRGVSEPSLPQRVPGDEHYCLSGPHTSPFTEDPSLKTCIVISLAVLAWMAVRADPVAAQTLRYAAEPGTTHTYVRTQRDHVTQTVNGAEQTADVNSYWRFDATMSESDGGRTVEIVHDSLSIQSAPQ